MWLKFLPIIGALLIGWLLLTFFGKGGDVDALSLIHI